MPFVLLCAAEILGYAHMSFLTPTLPLFIREQGGSATLLGFVGGAFSATAIVCRPFVGRAVDTWSARGTFGLGLLGLGISGLAYLIYHPVILFLVRGFHGVAWAGFNTGANVLVSWIAPAARRGEALGYFSASQHLASAILPGAALWLLAGVGFGGVFVLSGICGFVAAAAMLAMPPQPHRPAAARTEGFWRSLVLMDAMLPASLQFLTKLVLTAVTLFIPLYAIERGIALESLALYYLAHGGSTIVAVSVCGRWSDRAGRGSMIAVGAVATALGMLVTAQATEIISLSVGGALSGFGLAATTPSIMALTIDRSRPERRGAALATLSMAFQLAYGGGSMLWGLLMEQVGYSTTYALAALTATPTLLLLARYCAATNRSAAQASH
jgi:MFS family permease